MGIEASAPREAEIPTFPDLAGKVAVVTGGSGGIGAATLPPAYGQRGQRGRQRQE